MAFAEESDTPLDSYAIRIESKLSLEILKQSSKQSESKLICLLCTILMDVPDLQTKVYV